MVPDRRCRVMIETALVAAMVACGAACVARPGDDMPPPAVDRSDGVPASAITLIVRHVLGISELPVFVPKAAAPIYYFEYLPGAAALSHDDLRRISRSDREDFVSQPVDYESVVGLPGVTAFDPSDTSVCENPMVGHWIEVSPPVISPVDGRLGLFVRVTPKACMPFGGTRYWIAAGPAESWSDAEVVDLGVTEF
jgi:hypothetical protein